MKVLVCNMSENLRGFRSSGRFAALLTFPGIGLLESQRQAAPGGDIDIVVAGLNPATNATPGLSIP